MAPRDLRRRSPAKPDQPAPSLESKLGFDICSLSMQEVIGTIRGFLGSDTPHIVVTADAASAVIARRDKLYADIVRRADLVTPDGFGLLWACRLLGRSVPERICGVDLVPEIAKCCAYEKRSLFLLGGKPGVAERAAKELSRRFPSLCVCGTHHGYFDSLSDPQVIEAISLAAPDVLIVAMGAPRQEKWLRANIGKVGAKLGIGVGGSLDVISGSVRRAPRFMQRVGLEWLWRVVCDPRKLRKVALLPAFVYIVLMAKLQRPCKET
jgi:N-acetylglucosaminyldiphosphoundecaprenol N-acetyl-beta-D-mannosaminyltransferase